MSPDAPRAPGEPGERAVAAPIRLRLRAFLWDYLAIAAYLSLLTAVGAALSSGPAGERWRALFADPVRADGIAALLTVLPVVLYFSLGEGSASGATPGKRRVGICVRRRDGGRLTRRRALLRSALKFLPWQLGHTGVFHTVHAASPAALSAPLATAFLGLAWAGIAFYLIALWRDRRHRAPYDRAAGTVVVLRVPAPAAPGAISRTGC